MKTISIQGVAIQNYRCFKDEAVDFPPTPGLKFICGENRAEPRLGTNAVGKSALWEAIIWGMYGAIVRGGRASSAVTWGQKQVTVVLQILVGDQSYIIKRTSPPERIELNDKPANQSDIDKLFGISVLSFIHSVIFTQGSRLFPDLPIPERASLLDSVLNLDVWVACSNHATTKHSICEKQLQETKSNLSFQQGLLKGIKTDDELKVSIDFWEGERKKHLVELDKLQEGWQENTAKRISSLLREAKEYKAILTKVVADKTEAAIKVNDELALKSQPAAGDDFERQISLETTDLRIAENRLTRLKETKVEMDAELLAVATALADIDDEICPTCKRGLNVADLATQRESFEKRHASAAHKLPTPEQIQDTLDDIGKSRAKIDALKDQQSRLDESRNSYLREVKILQLQINSLNTDIANAQQELNKESSFEKQVKEIEKETNPFTSQINYQKQQQNPYIIEAAQAAAERKICSDAIQKLEADMKATEAKLLALEYWKVGFKRIRLFFVQKILTALEIEITSAMSSLGLDGWKIKLDTEKETKSGTLKFGIQITVTSPKATGLWEDWSGGETQRLRVAIGMGLASLIQRAAGVWYTFEVWDEPTTFLSDVGIDDLIEALRYRSEVLNKQVWLIEHRALQSSSFNELWTVVREHDGSKVYKTN